MAKITLPDEFQRSYMIFREYPLNAILKGTNTYRSALQPLKDRLDAIESDLCLVQPEDYKRFEVPIRDLHTASGLEMEKENIHSPERLSQWLGAKWISLEKKTVSAYKRDPKCRFIYIYAENSRDRLKITRSSLTELFTYHQVMPAYLDFMFVFGAQSDAADLRFSGFREQTIMKDPPRGPAIPDLGRSGRHFQLCYILKGVTLKRKSDENTKLDEWSIRQAAVYHQFDVVYGTLLWIVTKGRRDIQERFKEMTGKDGRPEDKTFDTVEDCLRSSLAAHLMYSHWSTEGWRWYIRWLESVIDTESSMAIYGPRGPGYAHKDYKPYHIQDLQYWLDKTSEAIMVLEANVDVISALQRFYFSLRENKDFPDILKQNSADDITSFNAQLDEIISDFRMQISRAKLLANIIRDRKELVLQHLQGQAAERTEQLNLNLEKEAIGMRIITIVTLVYLPATFVSTFFSTDVVKFQKQGVEANGDSSFSPTAMKRWLQVTLPLTAVTLFLAWVTYRIAETRKQLCNTPQSQSQPATGRQSTWQSLKDFVHGLRVEAPVISVPHPARKSMLPFHNDSKPQGIT